MDKQIIKNVHIALFVFTMALAVNKHVNEWVNDVLSSFIAAFNLFIYPGMFYYYANQQRQFDSDSLNEAKQHEVRMDQQFVPYPSNSTGSVSQNTVSVSQKKLSVSNSDMTASLKSIVKIKKNKKE